MLHFTVSTKGIPGANAKPNPWQHLSYVINGVTVTSRLNSLKQCLKSCSSFLQVDVLIIYKTCAYYTRTKNQLTRETYKNMRTEILPPLSLSCVQTSSPPPRHLQSRLVRPSLTFLGHHTLLIWQNWLNFVNFAPAFSVTAIFLETATTLGSISAVSRVRSLMSAGSFSRTAAGNRAYNHPTPRSTKFPPPPNWGP